MDPGNTDFKYKRGVRMVEGRCMKCKEQVTIQAGKETKTKNGMRMLKGKCAKCSTVVCKILGKA